MTTVEGGQLPELLEATGLLVAILERLQLRVVGSLGDVLYRLIVDAIEILNRWLTLEVITNDREFLLRYAIASSVSLLVMEFWHHNEDSGCPESELVSILSECALQLLSCIHKHGLFLATGELNLFREVNARAEYSTKYGWHLTTDSTHELALGVDKKNFCNSVPIRRGCYIPLSAIVLVDDTDQSVKILTYMAQFSPEDAKTEYLAPAANTARMQREGSRGSQDKVDHTYFGELHTFRLDRSLIDGDGNLNPPGDTDWEKLKKVCEYLYLQGVLMQQSDIYKGQIFADYNCHKGDIFRKGTDPGCRWDPNIKQPGYELKLDPRMTLPELPSSKGKTKIKTTEGNIQLNRLPVYFERKDGTLELAATTNKRKRAMFLSGVGLK